MTIDTDSASQNPPPPPQSMQNAYTNSSPPELRPRATRHGREMRPRERRREGD
uniref:Uncharacterized protein n=1 Tax=Arundo donax TaxID=35708 RepID=A0A0A9GJS7_ARUDO